MLGLSGCGADLKPEKGGLRQGEKEIWRLRKF
jgi:hypothetical protein